MIGVGGGGACASKAALSVATVMSEMMNGLRPMESSGSRDSTTGATVAMLDWLLAAAVAVALIVALAGVDARVFGLTIRAHSASRVLIVVAILLAIRVWRGVGHVPTWLTRMTLLVAITSSAAKIGRAHV